MNIKKGTTSQRSGNNEHERQWQVISETKAFSAAGIFETEKTLKIRLFSVDSKHNKRTKQLS